MGTLQENMLEYHSQLEKGKIQLAYKGLMEYLSALRSDFARHYPQFELPGALYFGYMDMSYFAIVPPSLKPHKLKIAVVFLHQEFRFEVWLSGVNRQVQTEYWQKIKESGWSRYPLVAKIQGSDAILEHILMTDPNFDDPARLTASIETGTVHFITEISDLVRQF
ncbi:MAG: hypothetical protein VB013_03905 [Anaerolineaceae bacterium]|nr:hypothetical protein [Anaerolineaceae bacterium]